MKFARIGLASKTTTKSGKVALRLTLDPVAQKKLLDHDFSTGIWIFRSEKDPTYYSVMVAMPDDYEISYDKMAKKWVESFEKKHQAEEQEVFNAWTRK